MVRIPKHQQKSILKKSLEESKLSAKNRLATEPCFTISLRHLDMLQGSKMEEWESTQMLAQALHKFRGLCSNPLRAQFSETFSVYEGFPPKNKTVYTHPEQVPPDAEWARIHVDGKHCLIGHVINNTFYLVFLDPEHKFWISELKNT